MKKITLLITAFFLTVSVFAQSTVGLKAPDELILEFQYDNPDAETVAVSGSFNAWDMESDQMEKNEAGMWVFSIPVKITDNFTFKYVVDGEYLPTMDGIAPSTVEDGYGGKNGALAVVELTAPGEGDEEVFRTKLSFGNYTELYSDNHFRTTSIAPDEDGDYTKGFENSKNTFGGNSYWKFTADILPGVNSFIEMKVFDGSVTLFEQSPGATADEENTLDPQIEAEDGFQSLADILFGPFYVLNGNAQPEMGHFKAGVKTPYVNLSTGYNNAKSDITSRDNIYRTFENDISAGDGYLEFTNGEKVQSLGAIGLNTSVGLTKRAGGHGIYSWVDLLGLGPADVSIAYNSLANRLEDNKIEYYGFDAIHTFGVGVTAKDLVPDMLDVQLEGLTTYDPIVDWDVEEAIAAGLAADFTMGTIFSTGLYAKWAGTEVKTLFGDDTEDDLSLDTGLFKAGISPSSQLMDLLKIGVNYDIEMDKSLEGDLTNKINPTVDVTLTNIVVNAYGKMEIISSDFDLTELGGAVTLTEIAMLTEIKVGYKNDLTSEVDDYFGDAYVSAHTEALDVELGWTNQSLAIIGIYDVTPIITANGGIMYRTENEVNPFGAAVGGTYTLNDKWRNGLVFLQVGYDFDPYGGVSKGDIEYEDDYLVNTGGENDAFLTCGISWDF